MKTYNPKKESIEREWCLIDAEGLVLGHLASEIAARLRGKHKPTYTPYMDTGDFIIVVNVEKAILTGKKLSDKMYHRHSGYPGGLKSVAADKMLRDRPTELLRHAVRGMLPKNTLGRKILKKLKIYKGANHSHGAQCPKNIKLN